MDVPEPTAIRLRLEPLMIVGSRLSFGVIEWIIASTRDIWPSSRSLEFIFPFRAPTPGIMPRMSLIEPIFLIVLNCSSMSSRSN